MQTKLCRAFRQAAVTTSEGLRARRRGGVATGSGLAGALLAAAALLMARGAEAAPPIDPAAPAAAEAGDDEKVVGRPLARDDRKAHVNLFAGATVAVPGGDLGSGLMLGRIADAGFGFEGGLGMGITRQAGLELRGQFVQFGRTRECAECQVQSVAVGLGLTYHAAQALAFDPWVRFGAGYRGLLVSGPLATVLSTAPSEGTFHGIDVSSFTIGGDFFPTPWFGLGVFLSGDVGINMASPGGVARGSVYGMFQAGVRIALEPQRKAVTVASGSPAVRTAVAERYDFAPSLYNRAAR